MFQQWKRQKDTESETEREKVEGIEDKGDERIGEMKQDW